jgi:hypothetical protein
MTILAVILGFVTLIIGSVVYAAVVGAWVISILWGWFVTPTFGIPVPPLPMVMGLTLTAGYLTRNNRTQWKDHETDTGAELVSLLIGPWLVLAVAWVIHLFA